MINTAAAENAAKNNNGQAWSCPQEMAEAKPGDYPHGLVDETSAGVRVWHDANATWYWL